MKHILIAEDDPGLSYVLKYALSKMEDLEVHSTNSGSEAWKFLSESNPVSLIVSDIVMPGLNGIELRRKILGNAELSSVPFIFITGRLEHVSDAKDLKPNLILTKPILADDFARIVRNLLFQGN